MYDARERAIQDRQWEIDAAERRGELKGKLEGEVKGEVRLIRTLQGLLGVAVAQEQELQGLNLEQLRTMTNELQEKLRCRNLS